MKLAFSRKLIAFIFFYICLVAKLYSQSYYPLEDILFLEDKTQKFNVSKESDSVLYYNAIICKKLEHNLDKSLKANNYALALKYGVPYLKKLVDNSNRKDSLNINVAKSILPSALKLRDTLALVDIYFNLGKSCYYVNDFVNSVLYLNEAMHVLDTTKIKDKAFEIYYQLGRSTSSFNRKEAIEHYKAAEQFVPFVNDARKNRYYLTMTAVLSHLPLEQTRPYFELLKAYSDIEGDKKQAVSYYNNLAYAYLENNRAKEAKAILEENLPWCSLVNDFKGCEQHFGAYYYHTTGAIERALGNYEIALKCFNLALDIAKMRNDYEDIIDYSREIASICKITKDYDRGFKVLLPLKAYADSLAAKEIEKQVKKKQSENLLKKEKKVVKALTVENAKINVTVSRLTLLLFFLVFLIVVAFGLYAFAKLRQIRIKQALNLNQLQNLTAAMNPHFLFNSFSALQNLILNNDTIAANNYMANLARLIRHFFYSFEHINIPFQKEIEILESYCKLEALRQHKEFSYTITVSHDLKEEQFFIPSMLIQPIVENAFKHAFTEKDKVYNLEISFKNTLNTDYIKCSIKDNGVGRVQAQKVKQSSHHLSVSSRNLDERIKIIQKQLKKEASITIIDLKDDEGNPKGTEVMLVLPKIHKTANFNSATLIKKG